MQTRNQKWSQLFQPFTLPSPQLSFIGIFHFCSFPTTKWRQINENVTCTCRVYLRPRWKVNFLKREGWNPWLFLSYLVCLFYFLSSYILNYLRDGELRCSDDKAIWKDLLAEAKSYQIQGIVTQLQEQCSFESSSIIKNGGKLSPNYFQLNYVWDHTEKLTCYRESFGLKFMYRFHCFAWRYILNYLRDGELLCPKDETVREELLKEAKFYQVQGIIEQLEDKTLGSSLIVKNETHHSALQSWLPPNATCSLLYRASTDGNTPADFHRCCDSKGPTLMLIKSGEYIFGGYTSKSWESPGSMQLIHNRYSYDNSHRPCLDCNSDSSTEKSRRSQRLH